MIFDNKDDQGIHIENNLKYSLEYTPCEYNNNDIVFIKLVGIEGKSNVTISAKYVSDELFDSFCITSDPKPPIASFPSVVYTPKGTIYYGGMLGDGEINDKMYILKDISKWELLNDNYGPEKRYGAFITYFNDYIILFGGRNKKNELLNDLWSYHLERQEWMHIDLKNINNKPSPRFNPSGEIMNSYAKLVIFGGEDEVNDSKIWILDLSLLIEISKNKANNNKQNLHNLWDSIDLGNIFIYFRFNQ